MKKIFLLASVLFFSCNNDKEIKPIKQDIKELVFASGELEWDNVYNLTAQTDGVLTNSNFEVGDFVSKGKTLAAIDNKINEINAQAAKEQLLISNENLTDNSPQIQQLKQNIQFADNKYKQDKIQVERYKKLYETQSIAKVELENIQLNASNSLSSLNALKKQILQIQQQAKQQQINAKGQALNNEVIKNYNSIVVTENGTVIKKLKTNGDYVKK
jgi:multidrug resistance efflux pump